MQAAQHIAASQSFSLQRPLFGGVLRRVEVQMLNQPNADAGAILFGCAVLRKYSISPEIVRPNEQPIVASVEVRGS